MKIDSKQMTKLVNAAKVIVVVAFTILTAGTGVLCLLQGTYYIIISNEEWWCYMMIGFLCLLIWGVAVMCVVDPEDYEEDKDEL